MRLDACVTVKPVVHSIPGGQQSSTGSSMGHDHATLTHDPPLPFRGRATPHLIHYRTHNRSETPHRHSRRYSSLPSLFLGLVTFLWSGRRLVRLRHCLTQQLRFRVHTFFHSLSGFVSAFICSTSFHVFDTQSFSTSTRSNCFDAHRLTCTI